MIAPAEIWDIYNIFINLYIRFHSHLIIFKVKPYINFKGNVHRPVSKTKRFMPQKKILFKDFKANWSLLSICLYINRYINCRWRGGGGSSKSAKKSVIYIFAPVPLGVSKPRNLLCPIKIFAFKLFTWILKIWNRDQDIKKNTFH